MAASPDPAPVTNFYAKALENAEALAEAARITGLHQEIAWMRDALRRQVQEHPAQFELAMKGMHTLVRMVLAEYRIGPKSRDDFADNMAAALRSIGEQLLPAGDER
ncbi:MAG TPA: hypothetical protein VFC53_12475 [Dehalococcoidia bacterium]|nr:hypothetical protein [Dehalococcoidia bacterium]